MWKNGGTYGNGTEFAAERDQAPAAAGHGNGAGSDLALCADAGRVGAETKNGPGTVIRPRSIFLRYPRATAILQHQVC